MGLVSCDPAALQQVLDAAGQAAANGALSQEQIGNGLKQALEIGITKGAQQLSSTNGYYKSQYKIPLPPEALKVTEKLRGIPGFADIEEQILEKINRGAEDAAKKAAPIFKDAITAMTFTDALDILMGADNAATSYLNRNTNTKLYSEFNPVIVASLDKFKAREVWSKAINTYNKIPFVEKVNSDLDDFVTKKALTGLFDMVAKKELDIRKNVNARSTDLLRQVFAKQDNK